MSPKRVSYQRERLGLAAMKRRAELRSAAMMEIKMSARRPGNLVVIFLGKTTTDHDQRKVTVVLTARRW